MQAFGAGRGDSDDGLPLPPPYLRVLTAGTADPATFLAVGRAAADEVLRLAEAHGPIAPEAPVLEFGVGCGRVGRHVARRHAGPFSGCDIDPRLLDWSRAHLPGAYALTRHDPPLPYADGAFGLTYALSVFTHLKEDSLTAWLAELGRVASSGALAILSFHDEHLPQGRSIRAPLLADGYAVLHDGDPGSNLLSVYVTPSGFAARAAPAWDMAAVVPSHASATGQAWAVFRRR